MNPKIERFPLAWPAGRNRKPSHLRESSRFKRSSFGNGTMRTSERGHSMAEAVNLITSEVRRMNGSDLIVSSNIKLRQDGLPYSGQAQPTDTGAAVYFSLKGKPVTFACDAYNRVECNLYAIGKTIEATRSIERWGAASLEQSFRGFLAIPEKTGGSDPWMVLGLKQDCTEEQLTAARNKLGKVFHPDIPLTGSHAKWMEISDAYNMIAQNFRKA